MNIVEALNVALPEIPARAKRRLPRMNPRVVARQQIEEGQPMMMVLVPEMHQYYRLTPDQWALLQLFDGNRTYQEVADAFTAQTNIGYSAQLAQEFAEAAPDAGFWYQTQQDRNATAREKLKQERSDRLKRKSKLSNLAEITFAAWDPDSFLTKLHARTEFLFSRWFFYLSLALFTFMLYVFVAHWSEIGRDSIAFFDFTAKGTADLVAFWILMFFIGFVHETCHGLGCKHAGGEVHGMGFLLIYLSPAFYCDTTEAFVYGGKWERIMTVAAGLWSGMIICSLGAVLWWGTPPGSYVHDFAYTVMLASGILPVLINLNPLIKLDGYFLFTELLEIVELKERSTQFVTAWVKSNIFRMPVEVPYVTFRRRLLYVPYTLLSGVYSYTLLFFVVSFLYNVSRRYSPEWAFLPALLLAWIVFKSRILGLGRFMKDFYSDKKDRVRAWLVPVRLIPMTLAALVVFFVPFWRETVEGRFILEPVQRAVLRAQVPGKVVEAQAQEGQFVSAGSPLLRLSNLALESDAAEAGSQLNLASARLTQAQIRYADPASARGQQQELSERNRLLRDQLTQLTLVTPISGVVVTPRVGDLVGSYLQPGASAVEVADVSSLRARIYVGGPDVPRVHVGYPARLLLDATHIPITGTVVSIAPASSEIEKGVIQQDQYEGMELPNYYLATVLVPNSNRGLTSGVTGTASIYVRRQSFAGFLWRAVSEFVGRKIW
jgi:putative peptide zinc metalloprotease protein